MGDPKLLGARHLLLRIALGSILAWFGMQQAINTGEWTGFVPSIISSDSPVAIADLILLPCVFPLLAATGIVLGLFLRKACLLAAGLLIIVGLVLTGDDAGLIGRDLGLLALAVA